MNPAPFSQVVQWPGTIVADDQVNEFVAFIADSFDGTRAQFIGCIETKPDCGFDGVPVPGTGGRIDCYFAVHEDDIPKFAVPRFNFGMRWVDDVIANESMRVAHSIYPQEVHDMRSWQGPVVTQSDDE